MRPVMAMPGRMIIIMFGSRPASSEATRAAATGRLFSSMTTPLTRAMAVAKNDFDCDCPAASCTLALAIMKLGRLALSM